MPSHLTKVSFPQIVLERPPGFSTEESLAVASEARHRFHVSNRPLLPPTIPMNARFLPGRVCALCACLPAFAQAAASAAASDGARTPSGTGDVQAAPAILFQVLRQWRVNAGDHTVILNRVVPPVLPPAPSPPAPPPAAEIAAAEAFEAWQPVKKSVILFLSATVYDRQVTEVRWFNALGEHRISATSTSISFAVWADSRHPSPAIPC